MIIVNKIGGGISLLTERRKEGKRRELLVLCETSGRRSEALRGLSSRLIESIGGDSYGK